MSPTRSPPPCRASRRRSVPNWHNWRRRHSARAIERARSARLAVDHRGDFAMRRTILSALALGAALGLAACAHDDFYGPPGYAPYGPYAYAGDAWRERRPYQGDLTGPGVETLDPWL